jgi:hypothetical protein
MDKKLQYAFLLPIGSSISGKLIPQLLANYDYVSSIGGRLYTIANRIHSDARNALATKGGGFVQPEKLVQDTEWLIWMDSDQLITVDQIKTLLAYDPKEKFVSGWYTKDLAGGQSPLAMIATWDEEYFKKTGSMKFWTEEEIAAQKEAFEVDYVGFGFCRVHSSIFEKMTYPYFRHNITKIGQYQDNSSEDVSFCLNAFKATGIKPKVLPELRVPHLKEIFV